jgi:hypothetical protein
MVCTKDQQPLPKLRVPATQVITLLLPYGDVSVMVEEAERWRVILPLIIRTGLSRGLQLELLQ